MTNPCKTKTEWEEKSFHECALSVRVDRSRQIKSGSYLPEGRHPIVDQGQGLIAGWTNEDASLIREGLPVIVFGDHTRIFKFVDFPFALGADGTKLIKPCDGINPRYFYYVLSALDIPSRGYSRHYGLLKEKTVPLPPLPEQKKIAAILLKLQKAIQAQDKIIQSLRDLKKSTMQHLFTHGLRRQKTRMTDFGSVPCNWHVESLGQCCHVQTGIAKGRAIADHEALELPYLRVANVQDGHLDLTEMKTIRLKKSEKDRYLLKSGDVVLTEGGDFDKLGRGFVWEDQVPDCVHQNHVFAVRADPKKLRPHFLAYQAQSPYGRAYFLTVAHKTTNLACINTAKLKNFPVLIPEIREQEQVIQGLGTISAKITVHHSKASALRAVFNTALNKLMTGNIRVADLEIDVKEVE